MREILALSGLDFTRLTRLLRRWAAVLAIALSLVALPLGWRLAAVHDPVDHLRDQLNSGRIGIMAGRGSGTYLRLAVDLAELLDARDIRIVPMVGKGSIQAVDDLLGLDGVDVAMMQSDVLDIARIKSPAVDLKSNIRYITPLYNEELHILARTEIESIWDLEGQVVNVGPQSAGSFMTSMFIFDDLGIEIDPRSMTADQALSALKSGRIAAMTRIVGQPTPTFTQLSGEDFHFLSVPADQVSAPYRATKLTSGNYPNLVSGPIETVAVSAVLATYIDPVSKKHPALDRFVGRFFDAFDRLQSGRYHPKWKDVDLTIELPGWQRLQSAERALNRMAHDSEEAAVKRTALP